MGRIKTKLIKRKTKDLMNFAGDKINENFSDNKERVKELMSYKSKKMRNIVAGYTTRLKKAQEEI
ncbi:MAG: 30S ribosomal protein S17e [Nanobdellota archaeon]